MYNSTRSNKRTRSSPAERSIHIREVEGAAPSESTLFSRRDRHRGLFVR